MPTQIDSMDPAIVRSAPPGPVLPALAGMPKVLLHDHLDGSLRVSTLIELCRQRSIRLPTQDPQALAGWFRANATAGSLERYLEGFALTVAAMADLSALERVAFEAAEDARAEGCVLAEFRMAPLLLAGHGIDPDEAVAAILGGLSRSALPCGLIICGMRQDPTASVAAAAELAVRHRTGPQRTVGVVGFDLAGPERGWPATRHEACLRRVVDAGLGLTLHAGEDDEAQRVLQAVALGAHRIGHGVRLADLLGTPLGRDAVDRLHQAQVHLEVCPTSNVQTGAAASIATHPIRALWEAGLSLSFHTDNHLISCTDLNLEGQALLDLAGFQLADLLAMQRQALQASFMPSHHIEPARRALDEWAASHDPNPSTSCQP